MAEQQKGTTVWYTSGTTHEAFYPDGVEVRIADGHLVIRNSKSKVIAAFAPGKWFRVDVDE